VDSLTYNEREKGTCSVDNILVF